MKISVEVEGDRKFAEKLRKKMRRITKTTRRVEARAARELRDEVRRRARPFRDTGAYESSIVANGNVVSTDHPAARRLELGFIGTDSMGRSYAQAPRPHWRPATQKAREDFPKMLLKEVIHGD